MKTMPLFGFVILIAISSCVARDLVVGSSYNAHLVWQQHADYYAFPFVKRVKDIFYSDPSQRIIKAIIARDIKHSDASAIITAGGVGFSFANIKIKSARGSRLDYQIEVYA
ncbi:hypothetical protein K1T71_003920 [Dendrolimus kikuchii]|uniref:Uncharacterized protein n=1 Tax=Dendrolimus kikuchii TaxID=765133 RepID=A0ACC1D9L3_9NEOP|nr:hypothetical protein K1T71_003920 [Dendrolimus kikuchii]